MSVAAIDIGTIFLRMVLVRIGADRAFEVVRRGTELVRLCAGGAVSTEPCSLRTTRTAGRGTRRAPGTCWPAASVRSYRCRPWQPDADGPAA